MEDVLFESYRQIMDGYAEESFSTIGPILKDDGSYVVLSAIGFYNNGEAASVAKKQ